MKKRRKSKPRRPVWKLSDSYLWPIVLADGPRTRFSPIWVWGDKKLAHRICRFLNRRR